MPGKLSLRNFALLVQERLKVYGKKIRRLESEEYLAKTRPSLEVNIAAANRFINNAIPDLSKEQKQALKQARLFHKQHFFSEVAK